MIDPSDALSTARDSARALRAALGELPPVALVLGSGWDALLESRTDRAGVSFDSLPGFCHAGSEGHEGRVTVLDTAGGPLLVQCGRLHCHEGHSALQASFPVFAYAEAGVRLLVMLSAAGGLNPAYAPGDLIVVRDHILLWGDNPLRGFACPPHGERSPHVSAAGLYPDRWQQTLKDSLPPGARVESGVYAYVPGPSYETPAEATLLRIAGCDVVGMSTAPEALVARYCGIGTAALCCVSNTLLPAASPALTHDSVIDTVRGVAAALTEFPDRLAANAYVLL